MDDEADRQPPAEKDAEPAAAAGKPAVARGAAAQAVLLARIDELEEAVRARDEFLALAAHELRSPMNTLALRLAVLEAKAVQGGDAEAVAGLRQARRAADRYVRRSSVLLDVSRLNAGKLEPSRTDVDIAGLVQRVVEDHRDEAALRGVVLSSQVTARGTGHWDEHMAEQILGNLVANAIKYGQGAPVRVRAALAGDAAVFEVADEGPGIPDADRERIFGKFERLVGRGAYRSGYGLGLWIVASMVTAHGGAISVESQPGKGALFRVTMPLHTHREDGDDATAG